MLWAPQKQLDEFTSSPENSPSDVRSIPLHRLFNGS